MLNKPSKVRHSVSAEYRVMASVYRGLLEILREEGHSPAELASRLGVDLQVFESPQSALDVERVTTLWQLGYDKRGPTIGIEVGARVRMIDFQDVGIFLAASENVLDWMQQMSRYSELFSNLGSVRTTQTRDALEVSILYDPVVPLKQERLEFIALIIYKLASQFLDSPLQLQTLALTRPCPDDPSPWEEAFQAPIRWGAPVTQYIISGTEAGRPLLSRNAQMKKDLQLLLDQRLRESRQDTPLIDVRAEIIRQLPDGPTADSIAFAMNLSVRSLQRKLERADYSFSQLLSEIRYETALHYLDIGATERDTADRLGYREISGFRKAFKRWAGMSPAEYLRSRRHS